MSDRSLIGTEHRQYKRLYPIVLCLETLTKINEWYLNRKTVPSEGVRRLAMRVPKLYSSGVYYEEEPPGEEEWLDIPHLYSQGFGDCEDLACARAAELRHAGIPAVPCIKAKQFELGDGRPMTLVHVLVLHPDGKIEDPSARLGMRGEYS